MKYPRILTVLLIVGWLCLVAKFDSQAIQYNYAPVETLPEYGEQADYIMLTKETAEYEVKQGDTLWGISRVFFGTGAGYEELFRENKDILSDSNTLMPGEVIRIPQHLYIPRDRYDRGGLAYEGAVRIAMPDMVDNNYFLTADIHNLTNKSRITVFSLPVTNRMGEDALTRNWEEFTAEVERCSKMCGDRVSNLQFEKYEVENGCDLCGYTFDFDTGEKEVEFAAFIRLGKQNMAEVIGVRDKLEDSRLRDVTRYIAASFEDFGGKIGMGFTKMTDNVGAGDWDYPELHNLFTAAMEEFVVYAERPQKSGAKDEEIVWEEPVFEQAVREALTELWQLDEEEKAAFLNRPLTESDTAVIKNIRCTLYPEGYPYAEEGTREASEAVLYLVMNGYWQKLYPGDSPSFSYGDLAHFTGAEKIEMTVSDLTDYSFLANMTRLRELYIRAGEPVEDVEFLAGLKNLRTLCLEQDYGYKAEGKPAAFSEITDMSVLGNCPELGYLFLQMPQLTDYSFLEKCRNICTIELSGETEDGEPVTPDLGLLPNARFIEFYGEGLRFEP